jgi:hypothetical protein
MFIPVLRPAVMYSFLHSYPREEEVYLASILVLNNTLIIAVLAVALYKIKKLLSEVPQVS